MITLIKEIAIRPQDASGALDTVKLTNIMEGVDGAATFGYNLETVAIQVEDNQTQQYKHIHTFDVRVIEESADSAIIDGWIATQTRVQIVGRGIDGFFYMNNVLLTRNKQYDEVFASAFLATRETLTSFVLGDEPVLRGTDPTNQTIKGYYLPIYAGQDLLGQYDISRGVDYAGGTMMSGWYGNSNLLYSYNTDTKVYTIANKTDPSRALLSDSFYAPYPDQIYKLTMNVVDIDTATGNDHRLGFIFYGTETSNISSNNVSYILYEELDNSTSGEVTLYASINDDLSSNVFNVRDVSIYYASGSNANAYIEYDDIKFEIYPINTKPAGLATTYTNIFVDTP